MCSVYVVMLRWLFVWDSSSSHFISFYEETLRSIIYSYTHNKSEIMIRRSLFNGTKGKHIMQFKKISIIDLYQISIDCVPNSYTYRSIDVPDMAASYGTIWFNCVFEDFHRFARLKSCIFIKPLQIVCFINKHNYVTLFKCNICNFWSFLVTLVYFFT